MQVAPSVHALRHRFGIPVAPGRILDRFVYSYLVYGESITLIDTGVAGCEERIFDSILSFGREPSEISLTILTHSHPDHIGAARVIQEETGCRIAAHPAERAWIEDVEHQNRERPVPGFAMLVGGSVNVDLELHDGDLIKTGGIHEMRVVHTPGHSPGSISLYFPREGVLFSGDAIPVPGGLPVYDDALASARSVQRLRRIPKIRLLLSAWDEPRRDGGAYRAMDRAASYMEMIHRAVLAHGDLPPHDLARRTADAIGLPP